MKTDTRNKRRFTENVGNIVKFFGWRLITGLLVIAGFLMFFGWLAEEVFEGETKIFDESIRNFVHGFAAPPLTAMMNFFSFIGSPLFLVILGAIVVAVFFYRFIQNLSWRSLSERCSGRLRGRIVLDRSHRADRHSFAKKNRRLKHFDNIKRGGKLSLFFLATAA